MPDTVVDRPAVRVLRPLARRRAVVVLLVLVLAVVGVATWHELPVLTLTGAAAFIVGYAVLRRSIDDVADKPDGALDERLVMLRNSAYVHAYRLFAALVGLALLAIFIAADSSDLQVTPNHLQTLFLVAMGASAALPSMVVAWRERQV